MKKLILIIATVLIFFSCQKTAETKKAPSSVATIYSSYGEKIIPEDAQNVSALQFLMRRQDSINIKLTGEIEKTCAMKGCWMTVKTGDSTSMRVTFKDYGFFVPKEGVEGKMAIIEGSVTKTETSVDVLRHFAQDEGKSTEEIKAITEPLEEYAFVANGVLIEETK